MKKTKTNNEPVEQSTGVHFRAEQHGLHFIVTRDQGSGFRPCGKNGLWSETPHLYRNEYLAAQAVLYFIENC